MFYTKLPIFIRSKNHVNIELLIGSFIVIVFIFIIIIIIVVVVVVIIIIIIIIIIIFIIELTHNGSIPEITLKIKTQPAALDFESLS